MAATRGTRSRATNEKAEEAKDQTPEEAEEAAAVAAEETVNEDQTEGEAQLANALAEQDEFEAVPEVEDKTKDVVENVPKRKKDEAQFVKVKVLKSGLMVAGRILVEGHTAEIPKELAAQSAKDQEKNFGSVYFEKI